MRQGVKYAQERGGNYVESQVADSEHLPWEDSAFDIIVCILSFHHYLNPEKSLDEMKRVLKKNGHITNPDTLPSLHPPEADRQE
jgi:ubiquinone/menaquinone biosynthesis C-methylase UbiE